MNKFRTALKEMEKIKDVLGISEGPLDEKPSCDNGEWKEIVDKCFNFEKKGDILEGAFIEQGKNKYGNTFTVETKPGVFVTFYGSTVIDRKMKQVMIGDLIRVTYLGEKTSKESKKKYKDIKIEVKK